MAREKQDYREQLDIITRKIEEMFPESMGMLTCAQVARYLHCDIKTVRANIKRKYNPLPAKNIGIGRVVYRIPIASLARWSLG